MAHPGSLSYPSVRSSWRFFLTLLLIACISVHPVTSTRSHARSHQNDHIAGHNRLDRQFHRRQLVDEGSTATYRDADSRISDRYYDLDQDRRQLRVNDLADDRRVDGRVDGSQVTDDRHDVSQRRRQLYEADAAIRALHHHHLPSGGGGGSDGGSGSYVNMEEEAFSSSLCWSVSERRYYQSPYSTATRMSDALFERIQRYTKTHAACTAAVADWPAFFNDP
ncbi:unnamed protein product, partial [Closterium sp. NIES-54]